MGSLGSSDRCSEYFRTNSEYYSQIIVMRALATNIVSIHVHGDVLQVVSRTRAVLQMFHETREHGCSNDVIKTTCP